MTPNTQQLVATPEPEPATDADAEKHTAALPEVVYSPESPLRHPVKLVREILSDIWKYRELTWVLFMRDLKAQYRQSYLGYFWMITPLISTALVWTFLASSKAIQVAETPIPYPLYVMLGSMIWGMFTNGVNQPHAGFEAGKAVFMKLKVPPEAFIISGLGRAAFETILRLIVLIPVFIALGVTPAGSGWLFPIGLLCASLFGLWIGVLLLPINALYQDVGRAMGIFLSLAMYVTPVVYMAPQSGWGATLVRLNPMSNVVITTRDWLTIGYEGAWMHLLTLFAISIVMLIVGLALFRAVLPRLVERQGM